MAAQERLEAAQALPDSYLREVFNGEVAKGWPERLLGDVVVNHDRQRKPVKQDERKTTSGDYPYYGASGIVDYVDDYIYDGEFLLVSEDGANLYMRSTAIAFLADGKFWVNNHAHVLEAIPPYTNRLLAYSLENLDIYAYISGAAQPKLSQQSMNKIRLRLPKESKAIEELENYISDKLTATDTLIMIAQNQLNTIEAMPSAILRKAFDGEI